MPKMWWIKTSEVYAYSHLFYSFVFLNKESKSKIETVNISLFHFLLLSAKIERFLKISSKPSFENEEKGKILSIIIFF